MSDDKVIEALKQKVVEAETAMIRGLHEALFGPPLSAEQVAKINEQIEVERAEAIKLKNRIRKAVRKSCLFVGHRVSGAYMCLIRGYSAYSDAEIERMQEYY